MPFRGTCNISFCGNDFLIRDQAWGTVNKIFGERCVYCWDLKGGQDRVGRRVCIRLPSWQSQQGHQVQNKPLTPRCLPRSDLRNYGRKMHKSLYLALTILMCPTEKCYYWPLSDVQGEQTFSEDTWLKLNYILCIMTVRVICSHGFSQNTTF